MKRVNRACFLQLNCFRGFCSVVHHRTPFQTGLSLNARLLPASDILLPARWIILVAVFSAGPVWPLRLKMTWFLSSLSTTSPRRGGFKPVTRRKPRHLLRPRSGKKFYSDSLLNSKLARLLLILKRITESTTLKGTYRSRKAATMRQMTLHKRLVYTYDASKSISSSISHM